MTTISVVQRDYVKRDGTRQIAIRITKDGYVRYRPTSYSVKANQFKEGTDNWIRNHPDMILINRDLERLRSEVSTEMITARLTGSEFEVKEKSTMFGLMLDRMNYYEKKNQVVAWRKLRTLYRVCKNIWEKDFTISSITKKTAEDFIIKRKASNNTIKKDLTQLAAIVNYDDEYRGKNYFKTIQSTIKATPVFKNRLSQPEIKKLETTELTGLTELAKDMFLFSYYCQGMRFQNVALFDPKFIKSKVIIYEMNKTGKVRELELHPKLKKLIDKYKGNKPYLFPIVKTIPKDKWEVQRFVDVANAMLGKHLKIAIAAAGIDKDISFHCARHSFADQLDKSTNDRKIVQKALNHSSIRTTERYLNSLSDDHVNKAALDVYGS